MYKLFIILFLSYFYQTFLQADIIKQVEVSGNKRVNSETIRIYGDIKLNKDYSEEDLNEILTNLYSTNFFQDVKINLSNNILSVQVKEYPVINELLILGEESNKYKEKIFELISLKQKDSFIKNRCSSLVNSAFSYISLLPSLSHSPLFSLETCQVWNLAKSATLIGDPIEVGALSSVYGENRDEETPLKLGALKSNIGHTETAAGVAGVIKVLMSFGHEEIPGNLHFDSLNPKLDLASIPARVLSKPESWSRGGRVRRAAVSGFGITGASRPHCRDY